VQFGGFELKAGGKVHDVVEAGLNLKTSLKTDPSFRQKLREKMAPRLGESKEEIGIFFAETIKKARMRSTVAFGKQWNSHKK
jgi:hypothetical protein